MRMTVRAERMVHGGRALARDDEGRVVLVAGALPGEAVEIEAARRRGVIMGRVERVLEPSPDRTPAPDHPGLDLGFASYERQLSLKAEVLLDAVHRAGVQLPGPPPTVTPSPRIWGYRSVVQPAVHGSRLGYRLPESDEVRILAEDEAALPSVRAGWERLLEVGIPSEVQEVVLRGNDAGEVLAAFVTQAPPRALLEVAHRLVERGVAGVAVAAWDARGRFRAGKSRLAGARSIRQRYGGLEITVSATSFAQPNPSAAGLMYEALTEMAPGGGTACELFAGSGVIAMHLAAHYQRVTCLEVGAESVARGQRDAARLGMSNVAFVRADVGKAGLPPAETVVVDPPRSGVPKAVRDAISAGPATTLLYVSCDVATWARDAAELTSRGWRLDEVRPFDFQPHTHHLELATRFVR